MYCRYRVVVSGGGGQSHMSGRSGDFPDFTPAGVFCPALSHGSLLVQSAAVHAVVHSVLYYYSTSLHVFHVLYPTYVHNFESQKVS
jgi:hypothetical protein